MNSSKISRERGKGENTRRDPKDRKEGGGVVKVLPKSPAVHAPLSEEPSPPVRCVWLFPAKYGAAPGREHEETEDHNKDAFATLPCPISRKARMNHTIKTRVIENGCAAGQIGPT